MPYFHSMCWSASSDLCKGSVAHLSRTCLSLASFMLVQTHVYFPLVMTSKNSNRTYLPVSVTCSAGGKNGLDEMEKARKAKVLFLRTLGIHVDAAREVDTRSRQQREF